MVFRIIAVLIAGAVTYALTTINLPSDEGHLRDAIGIVCGASATLLGFMVSSAAVLYAIAHTTLARNLQRTGHFNHLLRELFVAAGVFLFALILGLATLFVPVVKYGDMTVTLFQACTYLLIFVNIIAYLLLLPFARNLWIILSALRPEDPGRLE